MAHALHPNYLDKHESAHAPLMHDGVVIKTNCNQRYATTVTSATYVAEVAKAANVPVQEFVVRNDMACGSTIGPAVSSLTGILTADIGIPQFSMHSIRYLSDSFSFDAFLLALIVSPAQLRAADSVP